MLIKRLPLKVFPVSVPYHSDISTHWQVPISLEVQPSVKNVNSGQKSCRGRFQFLKQTRKDTQQRRNAVNAAATAVFKMMPKEKRLFRKSCHIDSFHWESLLVSRRRTNRHVYAWESAPRRRQSKYYPTSRSAGQVCSQLQRPTRCICCSSAVCAPLQQLKRISGATIAVSLHFHSL